MAVSSLADFIYQPWKENVPSAFQIQFAQWMADCRCVCTVYDLLFLPNRTAICLTVLFLVQIIKVKLLQKSLLRVLWFHFSPSFTFKCYIFIIQYILWPDRWISPRQPVRPQPLLSIPTEQRTSRRRRFNKWSNVSEWSLQVIMCISVPCVVPFHPADLLSGWQVSRRDAANNMYFAF